MATDFDPRFDPAYQRGYVAEAAPSPVEPVETSHRANPWLIVLWALAVLLLGVGVGAYAWAELVTNPSAAATLVVYPAIVTALAPWVAYVGLLGVILAVYVQAVQWRRG